MLSAGSRLGRYQIERSLGQGGTGTVFLAYDPTLERRVAIKLLEDEREGPPERARILREARTASALNHPKICAIYEVGDGDGRAYIAMEHVDGRPLSGARAELALARGDLESSAAYATDCVNQSRAHGRLKYEALGLITCACARRGQNLTRQATADARAAADAARRVPDPALQLATLSTLLDLEGSDELAAEARSLRSRIHAALPDAMKRRFEACEIVRRLAS
jgi:hypothetical protein